MRDTSLELADRLRRLARAIGLLGLLPAAAGAQAIPGDANADGRFGAADIAATVGAILEQAVPPGDPDCTADGVVDVRDVVCIVRFIAETVPEIGGFSPGSAVPGTLVTLTGEHLTLADGTPVGVGLAGQGGGLVGAPVVSAGPSLLIFVVPSGAVTGPVTVTAPERPAAVSKASLTILPSSRFELSVSPPSGTVMQGESTALVVELASDSGFAQLAALAVSGLPAGVTASWAPPAITAGQRSILTLSAGPAAALGTAALTLSAAAAVEGSLVEDAVAASLAVVPVTTSFTGRTVVADPSETPLAGVTVTALGRDGSGNATGCTGQAVSDAAGNFALTDLPAACAGGQLIRYDSTTVNSPPGVYAGVDKFYELSLGAVTSPPVLVHLPRIDAAPTVLVEQDAPVDQHFTFDGIPDLSVSVYAGTVFSLADGSEPDPFPLTAVAVPVDRLPDRMPPSTDTLGAFIVAFQPANTVASQPVAVDFPNPLDLPPGTGTVLSTLDPTQGMMVVYGTGTVSSDGRQVVPDFDPAHPGHRYGLVHLGWHGPVQPPPPRIEPAPPGSGPCPQGVKPIDPGSGLEILTETDLVLPGLLGSIAVERTYRTLSAEAGPFGLGTGHNFSHRLDTNNPAAAVLVNLSQPDGRRIPFVRGADGLLRNGTVPRYSGATLATPAGGPAVLRWRDGSTWRFAPSEFLLGSLLESVTDRRGRRITLTRDPARPVRITEIADPAGRRLRLAYDAADRITSITDPVGRAVAYTYNAQGTLESVTDPAGGVTLYAYDAQNRLATVTDARGLAVAQNTYDAAGRAIEQVQGDGGIWTFEYTLANPQVALSPVLETRITDPEGNATVYRFNPQGFLLGVADALGQTRVFEREEGTNRLVSVTGTAECDLCGDRAASGDLAFTYDAAGNLASFSDGLEATTTFTYEPQFTQIASVTNALGHPTSFSYGPGGVLATATDARGHTTTYAHDARGQLTSIVDPLGNEVSFAYDGFGNLAQVTDATGATTSWVHDAVSRPVERIDALGRRTAFAWDARDRLASVTDARGGVTAFAYDAVGNLLSVTDARGNATTYAYDALGRVTSRTDSLGAIDSWEYDRNGNVVRFVDRRGQQSLFTYDALERLVEEEYEDGTVERGYDARGRLAAVDDAVGGAYGFAYDAVGRLLQAASPVGVVGYERDALGRVTRRQVAGLPAVDYAYDPAGNLLSASLPAAAVGFLHDERGLLVRQERSNGVASDYAYDPAGRLLALVHAGANGPLNSHGYTYDALGRRSSHATDVASPLATAASANVHDALSNRLLAWGDTTYTYDSAGNRQTATGPAGSATYTWDGRGRLAGLALPGGELHAFRYDFAGNLVEHTTTAGAGDPRTRTFVLDEATNVVALTDRGLPSAVLGGPRIDQHWAVVGPDGAVEMGLPDGLGSTVAVTDGGGEVVARFAYEPFGATAGTGEAGYPFLFTGRVELATGLYHYRARAYDATTSAFVSEDPLDFLGGDANLYRYVGNDPVNLTDPTGQLGPLPILLLAGAVYGAYELIETARGVLDNAAQQREAMQACVDLPKAGGCDRERLLRKCQDANAAALRTAGVAGEGLLDFGGTLAGGPLPKGRAEKLIRKVLSPLFDLP